MKEDLLYALAAQASVAYEVVMPAAGLVTGIATAGAISAAWSEKWLAFKFTLLVALAGALPLALPAVINLLLEWADTPERIELRTVAAAAWCSLALLGGLAAGGWSRWVWPRFVDQASAWTRPSMHERERKTDARTVTETLPAEVSNFDPLKHIRLEKGVFIGLDPEGRPIYIPYQLLAESHVAISGRTRAGKGVAAQALLVQSIQLGEFVLVLDPKGDAWLPSVLRAAAEAAQRPYHFIDLSPSAGQQFNPFADTDEEDTENSLIAAFSLADKGEAADFYRVNDRRAALEFSRAMSARPGATIREIFATESSRWEKDSKGFQESLRELADLNAINCKGGTGLVDLARSGGVVYVVGDMDNSRVVRTQRLLLVRLLQIAKRRSLHDINRRFVVFADEFRVHVSRPFMNTLAASAGWGLRAILTFQSLQDLTMVPGDLSAEGVKGSIAENCAISLTYRLKDSDTAEWVARGTGTILVDDETRAVAANWALAETVKSDRTIRQAERYRIDVNQLLYLPKRCGALIGAKDDPLFCFTSPVKVALDPTAHMPTLGQDLQTDLEGDAGRRSDSLGDAAIDLPDLDADRKGAVNPQSTRTKRGSSC
jgi:hypothetical protein